MKYDLTIVHRVCPALAKTAAGFSDKFEMVKATTESLLASLNGIRTRLIVLLDGCDAQYERLFDDAFLKGETSSIDYQRIPTPKIGNQMTYAKQLEMLSAAAADSDFLYFSEDDYVYRTDAFRVMMRFLVEDGVDFVTPLDHPDQYSRARENSQKSVVRVSADCHWRETATTCCTFMFKASTLACAERSLAYYAHGGADFLMWLLLTKKQVFSARAVFGGLLRYAFSRPRDWMDVIPALAWLKLNLRLLTMPKFRLWSPVPTLAVHLCKPSLPPFAEKLFLPQN